MEGKFLTISDAAILAKKLSILRFDVDDSYGTPYIGIDWGLVLTLQRQLKHTQRTIVYISETLVLK